MSKRKELALSYFIPNIIKNLKRRYRNNMGSWNKIKSIEYEGQR